MEKQIDNYLISKLNEGKKLDITLISHNAYWTEILKLDSHFENCNVMLFGGSISYIKLADVQRRNQIENSDLIIFYSSRTYSEASLTELKDIASKISNAKNKRVSIGYLYHVPIEERVDENISVQVKIISFKNDEEIIKEIYPTTPYFTAYDLTELTLATSDSYDIDKPKKLEKKLSDITS